MSQELTNAIVKHIFENLGVFSEGANSITHKELKTKATIPFVNADDTTANGTVWACSSTVQAKKFHIMCVDMSDTSDIEEGIEATVLIKLEGVPIYCCSLNAYNTNMTNIFDSMIACTLPPNSTTLKHMKVKDKELIWMPATPYIQATFLAGMEQLRDLGIVFGKMADLEIETHLNDLKSFLKWKDLFAEEEDAGTEN